MNSFHNEYQHEVFRTDCIRVGLIGRGGATAGSEARTLTLLIDNPAGTRYLPQSMEKSGLGQFLAIMLKPDNIPIVGLMVLVFFFSWLAFREARKNDQLIEEGRADEILKEMQE
jgi:hypothetical protein